MTLRERVLAALDHKQTDRVPLQFSAANMDPKQLKDNYGKTLCFEGGMCVQKVLPFGSVEEVRDETRGY